MSDDEITARLNFNEGTVLAVETVIRQLVRVIQERHLLTTPDLTDVFSEALASIKTSDARSDRERAVAACAARAVERIAGQ